MSENAKTITFVVVGLAAILIGVITTPSTAVLDESSLVGTNLTKKFESPDVAKRLRIVRFDPDTAMPREFEVAEQNGLWTIPSKEGYPADAVRQMAEAATSLMDRKILSVISSNAGDHEEYGVIDPTAPKLEPGQKGVGTRVTMSDEANKPVVDLIVGKGVRDAEKQRYVRVVGQDVVYVIEIDPAKLTTNFEDWIEKDLLKFKGWDLQQVEVKDYSAELVPVMTQEGPAFRPTWGPRAEMTLNYSDTDAKWNPGKLRAFDAKKGDHVDFTLAADEELNDESLNGLKTALEDLKIVDVVHKPQGLSNDLKAGKDFMKDEKSLTALASKGFTPAMTKAGGSLDLVSSDGEVKATMKNGTQYVLRFGKLTNVAGSGQDKEEKAAKDAKADAKDGKADKGEKSDVHRYLFVMAQFDESSVKRPELEKLPDLPAGAPKAGEKPADVAAAPKSDDAAKKEDAAAKKDDEATKKADAEKKDAAAEKKEDTAAKKGDADAKKADEATAKKDDAAAKDAAPSAEKEVEKVIAERTRIEKDNQKKLDEYQALIKKGQENVKDLNLRFGDWYFVVSDDVFHKIRLSRDKVVKKKEKPKTETPGQAGKADGAPPTGIPGLPSIPGASK
jgi:hypothetical protein